MDLNSHLAYVVLAKNRIFQKREIIQTYDNWDLCMKHAIK